MLHFARVRDVPFTLITAFVLAVLAVSVIVGLSPWAPESPADPP